MSSWCPTLGKFTARFAVVNVFDTIYLIRDGSGIGVFAPQYGPRRGFLSGCRRSYERNEQNASA